MNPGDIIPFDWNLSLIALSYLAAIVGSFIALQCAREIPQPDGSVNRMAIGAAAVALGGGGIWYMHFIGMAAFEAPRAFLIRYDLVTTIASMLAAIIVAAMALYIVGLHPKRWANLLLGGILAGSGVAIMHYIGMGAMRMQALIEWNATIVAVSVAIAIIAATAALWLTFHTRRFAQRAGAALLMGLAVCGMHYTGMYAGTFICIAPSVADNAPTISSQFLPYAVAMFGTTLLVVVSILNALGSKESAALA